MHLKLSICETHKLLHTYVSTTTYFTGRGRSVIGRVLGFGDSGPGSIPGRGFDLRGGLYVQIGIPLLSH